MPCTGTPSVVVSKPVTRRTASIRAWRWCGPARRRRVPSISKSTKARWRGPAIRYSSVISRLSLEWPLLCKCFRLAGTNCCFWNSIPSLSRILRARRASNSSWSGSGAARASGSGGGVAPLLLFDAGRSRQPGVVFTPPVLRDGVSGTVLQTPIQIANQHDRGGRALPNAIRLAINGGTSG